MHHKYAKKREIRKPCFSRLTLSYIFSKIFCSVEEFYDMAKFTKLYFLYHPSSCILNWFLIELQSDMYKRLYIQCYLSSFGASDDWMTHTIYCEIDENNVFRTYYYHLRRFGTSWWTTYLKIRFSFLSRFILSLILSQRSRSMNCWGLQYIFCFVGS